MSFLLGVLLALVPSGYSLSCTECTSTLTTSCSGYNRICPHDSVCGAAYIATSDGSTSLTVYTMLCTKASQCDKSGSVSLPFGKKMKIGTSCCTTDYCIPTLPSLPTDNSVSNGLKCPSCLSFYSPWCNSSDTMQCTGNENMCLLQTEHIGEAVPRSTAYRGCTTKSICDLGNLCYSHNGILTDVRFRCTSGSTMGLQTHFYLPSIICLLFLKLQFVL